MASILNKQSRSEKKWEWNIIEYPIMRYEEALRIQKQLWKRVQQTKEHFLLLLEHFPVITKGIRTDENHILNSQDELAKQGIDLINIARGGSATYHGPGQLVGYLICKPSRYGGIHHFVKTLLDVIALTITDYGISVNADIENPGVWTSTKIPRKLSAIGLSNSHGYTMHGFALNVDMLLTGFQKIIPCGLLLPVTTMSIELGKKISIENVKTSFISHFLQKF